MSLAAKVSSSHTKEVQPRKVDGSTCVVSRRTVSALSQSIGSVSVEDMSWYSCQNEDPIGTDKQARNEMGVDVSTCSLAASIAATCSAVVRDSDEDHVNATVKSGTKACASLTTFSKTNKVSCEGTGRLDGGGSVLRYALHMRFLCPPLKTRGKCRGKDTQNSASSVPSVSSGSAGALDERRFYIYGDLRAVFPRRQSDADEGKVTQASVEEYSVLVSFFITSSASWLRPTVSLFSRFLAMPSLWLLRCLPVVCGLAVAGGVQLSNSSQVLRNLNARAYW